jgi:hypothetical protein
MNAAMDLTEVDRTGKWKTRTTLMGGVLGALTGAGAAWMFLKSGGYESKSRIKPDALIAVGIGVLSLLRQISNLGEE